MARQRVARVSSVLAIVLALVAIPVLASGAPAADRAALADIRTTPLLDDFDRPKENPLWGGGSWAKADASSNLIQLVDNQVTLPSQTSIVSLYQWVPQSLDGDVEVWATFKGGLDDGAAADLGIVTEVGGTNEMDGYVLRAVNTFGFAGWQIRKRTNWGGVQVLAQAGFSGGGVSTGHVVLFRREGNALAGLALEGRRSDLDPRDLRRRLDVHDGSPHWSRLLGRGRDEPGLGRLRRRRELASAVVRPASGTVERDVLGLRLARAEREPLPLRPGEHPHGSVRRPRRGHRDAGDGRVVRLDADLHVD